MKTKEIILASASPRRMELMKDMQLEFTCIPSCIEEHLDSSLPVEQGIEQLAFQKAEDVFKKYPDAIVIGSDTMVVLAKERLGKPKDVQDAKAMLRRLSGQTHQVITGVAILYDDKQVLFHECSDVTFYDLDDEMIDWYIDTKEPFDKAGSYGIQGYGKLFVKEIKGDYFNIVGLPVAKLYRTLQTIQ